MPRLIDMTGQVFGQLTVLSRVPATGQAMWECRCTCGEITIQPGYELRSGAVVSCGCAKTWRIKEQSQTHGMTGTKEYRAWINMRNRCSRPNVRGYERYGAIGIAVSDRWLHSFENFFADLGPCPEGHSLDRIDPSGDYSPSNCRWANIETQANNKKRVAVATLDGETKPLAVWCRELGLSHRTIRARVYKLGWTPERALKTPIRG